MAPLQQKVIRALFSAGERVAPALAGRAAFELFMRTPDRGRQTEGEGKALERAAPLLAEARRHCLTTRRGRITAFEFRPREEARQRGSVLVLHGWASRTEHMKALIEALHGAGWRVVALDLPGHGASSGRRLNLAIAVEAVRLTAEWLGPFSAAVGHSFGGAIALNAAAGSVKGVPALPVDRLVLIAAPSSMPALFRDFGGFVGVGARSYRHLAGRVETVAGHPLDHYVGSRLLSGLSQPTLVIHAADDREVAAWHAEDHAAAGDHVRLEWMDGLGHRRILADPRVAARTVAFVGERNQATLTY
jgi:pimeloyl-ACP methyl ester carboxylesterase